MKSLVLAVVRGAVFLLLAESVQAQIAPTTNDVWDVSQGNTVTNNSATYSSDILGMFGFVDATSVKPGNVIFQDNQRLLSDSV